MESYKIGDFLEYLQLSQIKKRFVGDYDKAIKNVKDFPLGAIQGMSKGLAELVPGRSNSVNFNLNDTTRIISIEGDIIFNPMNVETSNIMWHKKISPFDNSYKYQFSQRYNVFNFKESNKIINDHYFMFMSKWNWFYQYLDGSGTGARKELTVRNFLNVKVNLPSLEKQQQLVDKLLPIYKVYHNICRILDKLDDYYRLIINLLFPAIDSPKQYLEKINAKYLFAASYLHKVSANYKIYSHSSYRRSNSCAIDLKNYSWSSEAFNLNPVFIKKTSINSAYKFKNRIKILPNDLYISVTSPKAIIGIVKNEVITNMKKADLNSTNSQNDYIVNKFSILMKSHFLNYFNFRRLSSSQDRFLYLRNQLLRSPFYISEKLIEELIPTFTRCYQNSYTYFQKQKRIYFNYFKALLHKNFVTKEYCPIPKVSGGLSEKEG